MSSIKEAYELALRQKEDEDRKAAEEKKARDEKVEALRKAAEKETAERKALPKEILRETSKFASKHIRKGRSFGTCVPVDDDVDYVVEGRRQPRKEWVEWDAEDAAELATGIQEAVACMQECTRKKLGVDNIPFGLVSSLTGQFHRVNVERHEVAVGMLRFLRARKAVRS